MRSRINRSQFIAFHFKSTISIRFNSIYFIAIAFQILPFKATNSIPSEGITTLSNSTLYQFKSIIRFKFKPIQFNSSRHDAVQFKAIQVDIFQFGSSLSPTVSTIPNGMNSSLNTFCKVGSVSVSQRTFPCPTEVHLEAPLLLKAQLLLTQSFNKFSQDSYRLLLICFRISGVIYRNIPVDTSAYHLSTVNFQQCLPYISR